VGLQFIPTHWDVSISDLRVLVVLPAGVAKDQIRVTPDWDNAFNDPNEDDRLVVYWERQNVSPGTTFQIGVSFPTSSVEHFETSVTTTTAEDGFVALAFGFAIVIVVLLAFLGIVIGVAKAFRRAYADPKMLMETLGIRRGLTAVEASYLLELPPAKIIVMILYSLLQKRAAWVNSTEPSLRLQISNGLREGAARPPDRALRYYEEDFLKAVKPNGTLDEKQLAQTFMRVRTAVENSLRGYCRADTIAFYRKTAQQAWEQVEKAATADVASKLYDENLLWLMMDANFRGKTETAFREIDFHPLPFWWWYWYGYTQYHPNPTYHPTADSGGPTPTIPGAEFANNIATSLEKTAGNFVTNLEKFANSILPAPPRTQDMSRKPVHDKASCVCACVSCACVCACVSCACACASGGGVG
jgi:hypothetical protein